MRGTAALLLAKRQMAVAQRETGSALAGRRWHTVQ
jgi:hypothetical protein